MGFWCLLCLRACSAKVTCLDSVRFESLETDTILEPCNLWSRQVGEGGPNLQSHARE